MARQSSCQEPVPVYSTAGTKDTLRIQRAKKTQECKKTEPGLSKGVDISRGAEEDEESGEKIMKGECQTWRR